MLIPSDTLVLVSDGRKALFLRNHGGAGHPELVTETVMEQNNPATRDQGTDRPGRNAGTAAGLPKSAMEQTDFHQQAEDRFAVDLAEVLYKKSHIQDFQHLIVVAPPRALGTMRSAFRKEVAHKITAEIAKDLTSHPIPEIARLLKLQEPR
jgi:protein required for attachment to host cells